MTIYTTFAASSAFHIRQCKLQKAQSSIQSALAGNGITPSHHQHRIILRFSMSTQPHRLSHTHSCHSQDEKGSSYILSLPLDRAHSRLTRAPRLYNTHIHTTQTRHSAHTHTHTHTDIHRHTYVHSIRSHPPASFNAIRPDRQTHQNHTLTRFHLVGGRAWHVVKTNGKNPTNHTMKPPSPLPSHSISWKNAMHWCSLVRLISYCYLSAHTTSKSESTARQHPWQQPLQQEKRRERIERRGNEGNKWTEAKIQITRESRGGENK